ncbi:hypothetical protein [Spirosoma harenae]
MAESSQHQETLQTRCCLIGGPADIMLGSVQMDDIRSSRKKRG